MFFYLDLKEQVSKFAEIQQFIADDLKLPIAEVYSVVTFYNYFSMTPQGKHLINLCTETANMELYHKQKLENEYTDIAYVEDF